MSKKMLKRSLALGALMAFVITGSAMAAELQPITGEGVYSDGAIKINSTGDAVNYTDKTNNAVCKGVSIVSTNGDVEIASTAGHGIYAYASRIGQPMDVPYINIESAEDITITANTSGKYAIFAQEFNENTTVNGSTMSVNIQAQGDLSINGTVNFMACKDYNVFEGNSVEILAKSGNALMLQSSNLDIIAKENIKIESTNGTGVLVSYSGNQKVNGQLVEGNGASFSAPEISIVGKVNAINVKDSSEEYGYPKFVLNANKISIEGHISVQDNGTVTIDGTGDYAKGYVANINGNVTSKSDATVNIDLGTNGSLTGKVTDANVDAVEGKGVNLDLGTDSVWTVTGDSNVSTLAGSGNVDVADLETSVEVVTDKTGYITVSTSSDNLGADVNANMKTLKALVATTEGVEIADKLMFTAGKYYGDVIGEVDENGDINITQDKTINEANINISDAAALGLMSWRAEMNDMNKRMGELRNANGEHGVWVRMVRGEDEYKSVNHDYTQYQLGYDEKLSVDKRWTVGMALSYTDGETSFAKGNGENTNKALSIYGSKLNDDGTFVDLIAKYARLENEFNVTDGIGGGDYSTNGYSFSAEFGKRIQQGKGLWIEPQVELTYGKVSAVDYVTKNDVNVAQDGMESIVGRVGFSIGKNIEKGNVYARASYLYDFEGETSVNLDGRETLEQDLGGGWWEVGVGANINLSKATYIYADVEKTFGGEVDTNWQWNLGVRYSF